MESMGASFQSIIEHASMVEGAKARAFGGGDKRPRQTGSYGGSSSRGAGQFSRPHQPYFDRPVHSALQASPSEPPRQRAPESSFSRPVDRAASSGSSVSVYQHSSPITCFSCGEVGHVARRCPRPRRDYQPPRTPISSGGRGGTSQRGGAQSGHGASHGSRGGSQPARGGSQSERGGSRTERGGAHCYSFRVGLREASDVVISGTIYVRHRAASVLFDPGSTYSYVSAFHVVGWDLPCDSIDIPVHVSTPVGDSVIVDRVYRSCLVTFMGYDTWVDLMILDMVDFDIILGMSWLSPYHAILDCHAKTVTLAMPGIPRLEWRGTPSPAPKKIISFLRAKKLVSKGCLAYLAHVRDTTVASPPLESIPIVSEFAEVFPSDLPGMPPDRDIDFCIDLDPGTRPISIPPYRMAPAELRELKEQLYEHQRPGGVLQRMPIPEWKWERITMDFVMGLPKTLGKFDSIWVIVDRLTKSAHFVPVQVSYTTEKLAKMYIRDIVRLHGVPISIVSDRGTIFTSRFWRAFHEELGTRLDLSTTFHPQTDGQSERTIQVLEDMLRACVIDFGGHWDQHLPLVEFAYNNSYHSSIGMAPFEALYGRRCRSPVGWFDGFEARPWSTDLLRESLDRVRVIQAKLLAAQSRQKMYADRKVRDLEFAIGDQVLLKVSPMKGVMRFGKKGKLSPRYIGPFKIIGRMGDVAYELALLQGLAGVHPIFHVSMLKKYHADGTYIVRWDSILLDENLTYEEEPIAILDRQVRKLRSKEIASMKVQWKHRPIEKATWETKSDMRSRYPQLFTIQVFSRFFLFFARGRAMVQLVSDVTTRLVVIVFSAFLPFLEH
ncbi:uncharacterized protein LOC132057727 [Lycium ferocissimum]|uniref:uncharacterized protein LOC132057727 n=1 Tax=Lycium ferocissimum TaxID=112874 RepID=UPI00281545A4|nr:uncharacterized protein LOC132057727 [Lycium ferocissimum]